MRFALDPVRLKPRFITHVPCGVAFLAPVPETQGGADKEKKVFKVAQPLLLGDPASHSRLQALLRAAQFWSSAIWEKKPRFCPRSPLLWPVLLLTLAFGFHLLVASPCTPVSPRLAQDLPREHSQEERQCPGSGSP